MRLLGVGGEIVRLRTSNPIRDFAVHTDLLCDNSLLVKSILQPNRKLIDAECECPICQERVVLAIETLVYCRTGCGQNMHRTCFEAHAEHSFRMYPNIPIRCPYCRADWPPEHPGESPVMLLLRGEPVALEAYIGWLYSAGHLDIRTSFGESDYEFTVNVFRALILAIGMADPRYKRAVVEAFIDKRPAVTQEVISWIYDSSNVSALIPGGEVYNFLVDYTMTRYTNERDRFKTLLRSGACPERFVAHCKFFISCRHGRNIRWLSEVDLLRKYTRLYLPGLPIPVARADWEEVRYWHDVSLRITLDELCCSFM